MNQELDELRLQRLVDGVLSDAQRRNFLASLDARPDGWREVALAFIEEQIWADGVRSPAGREPSVSQAKPTPVAVENSTPWLQWVALAACLLVMLGAGMWIGQWTASDTTEPSSNWQSRRDQIVHGQPADNIEGSDFADSQRRLYPEQLEIEYADGPSRRSLVVPVYHESQVTNSVWGEDSYAADIERINRKLAPAGYCIEWQTEYLGGNLAEGNQLVVPVRAISLRQRGQ